MQRSVVGGRGMTANDEKIIIQERNNCSVDDFDAISLYPSAMESISICIREKPEVLKELSIEFLKTCDDYFVRVPILAILVLN